MLRGNLIILAVTLIGSTLFADDFTLDSTAATDTVYIESQAKLEFFNGLTTSLVGSFRFNPDQTTQPLDGMVRVDLRKLITGIEMRDDHMRRNHLHTDDYPFAYFELEGVSGLPPTLQPDTAYRADGSGLFYIHGSKRRIPVAMEVTLSPQEGYLRLDVRASFEIRLDDYEIERPRALFLKLAETINVRLIFSAHNNLEAPSLTLPAWQEIR